MANTEADQIIQNLSSLYNTIASEWDSSRQFPTPLKKKLVNDIQQNWRVLDLGCGNGLMIPFILEKGAKYTGVDISTKMIDVVRNKYTTEIQSGQVTLWASNVLDWQSEERFDFIISFAVLHHIPSVVYQEKFLQVVKKHLKPQGKAVIIVWNLLNEFYDNKFGVSEKLMGGKSGELCIPWKATQGVVAERYIYQFSVAELQSLAMKSDFSRIQIEYYNQAGELENNGEDLVMTLCN